MSFFSMRIMNAVLELKNFHTYSPWSCWWGIAKALEFLLNTVEIVYNETGYNEQLDITSKFGAEVWSRI